MQYSLCAVGAGGVSRPGRPAVGFRTGPDGTGLGLGPLSQKAFEECIAHFAKSNTPRVVPASTKRASRADGIDGNEASEMEQPEIEASGGLIEKLELTELDVVVGGWSEAA